MAIDTKKIKKILGVAGVAIGTAFVGLNILAKKKKADSIYRNEPAKQNPFEGKKVVFVADEKDEENADGVRGHLKAVGKSDYNPGIYDKYIKRAMDIVLSFGGLVVLSPLYAGIAIAIMIDDPGPILFTQKRLGQNKKYFKLHKFRSMKMSTPHDVPTHMLDNPEQYITRVGKFLRAHSLDELPQIWDIFIGNMSVIGPRPGLWNQDVLTAERDKYGANDVKPGLTGWAQINGRDELEIPVKAKLDGEYVKKESFLFDVKCFLGSVGVFAHDESVVEGGTGEMKKAERHYTDGKSDKELIGNIGFGEPVTVDKTTHKKVLITGTGSYIGESFIDYVAKNYSENFSIDSIDMLDPTWRETDFSQYDIVYHVAGIAHADVGHVDEDTKQKYYAVNTDLAIEVCKKAKVEGVKEFIFMSSMIVYGDSAPYGKEKIVGEYTVPKAANFYGDSKFQADVGVRALADDNFKVIVLRPPMIYGKGSKGNYPILAKLAKKLPIFPNVENRRSMLYIGNLCEFLCQIMLVDVKQDATVLIPQNAEWTKTSQMVEEIAKAAGKKIITVGGVMKLGVAVGAKVPGKIGGLVNKAFGNSCYAMEMSEYEGINYRMMDFKDSIVNTEKRKLKIAYIALRGVPISDGIVKVTNDIASELSKRGHDIVVYTGRKYGNQDGIYNNYKIKTVSSINISFIEKMSLTFNATLKAMTEDFDIYHFEAMGPSICAIIPRIFGKNVVIQSHGIEYDRPKWGNFAKFVLKLLEKMSINNCNCLTVVSKKLQRHFLYEYNKETKYIPNFSDMPKDDYNEKLLEKYNLEPFKYFLFLNRIDAGKGLHFLIEAYNRIDTDIKLAICGPIDKKDEYHQKILNMANKNPNIVFVGFVKEELKTTMYKFAYACCQTSESEGMSTSLLEIMSFSKCGIVSDIEENMDVVEECALSFKTANVDSLCEVLKEAINNPQKVCLLGDKAYNLWKKNYTLEKVTEQYEKMYEDVVNEKGKKNFSI